MKNFITEQEQFWAGEFGNAYIERNQGKNILASKIALFAKIISRGGAGIVSCLEFGANIGLNLQALGLLLPQLKMGAVEINAQAAEICSQIENVTVFNKSILEFESDEMWDLTFTSGVLIHIAPEQLDVVYSRLYKHSKKYILVAEYYNPTPVEVVYRGNTGKLFKRDFAGGIMDKYPDVELLDYGFVYHRDHHFPMDDLTWFLMEKK